MENALFATLDTAVRRTQTRDGRLYAYVDTVGFVRRLPTNLVEAFKSTLEEIADATSSCTWSMPRTPIRSLRSTR